MATTARPDDRVRFLWHQNTQMESYVRGGVRLIVQARGNVLRDASGREYLDGLSSHNCCSLGHGRQEIVDAIARQLTTLDFSTIHLMSHEPALRLAERLAELAPGDLDTVYFANSGAEANEIAIKLARQYFAAQGQPSRYKIIGRYGSYHGNTMATAAAGGNTRYRRAFGPLPPGFVHIPGPGRGGDARTLEEAIRFEGPDTVAAFIAEPVAVSDGVRVPDAQYWPEVADVCRRHGVLLIADEVICGLGRTGAMFGCNHWNIEPDLMTLGKSLSGGYFPISAVIIRGAIRDTFWASGEFPHFVTYSGHPGGCAAALAVLDILARENLVPAARKMGTFLLEQLRSLGDLPVVGEVSGIGMLLSVELLADRRRHVPLPAASLTRIESAAVEHGLFCGIRGHSLFLAPPFTLTPEEARRMVEIIRHVLGAVAHASA